MKLHSPLAALAAACVLAGCENPQQASRFSPEETLASMNSVKAFITEQRTMFVSSMQKQLADMDEKIAGLSDAIRTSHHPALAKENLDAIRELRAKLGVLFEHLSKLDAASTNAESWNNAQRTFESEWIALQQAYQLVKTIYAS